MNLCKTAMAVALSFAIVAAPLGCNVLQPTKTASGQLYQSGDTRYDPYFASVHEEQRTAASWRDEAKSSRKAIVKALDLDPEASNSRILSATRSKKGQGSVGGAVEQTTSTESDRARRLHAAAARLDELRRRGDELKRQAAADRENMGADKADRAKVEKKDELKREISAAVDAVESMASDARKGSKEAEELAAKLRPAWSGRDEDDRPMRAIEEKREKNDDEKKPEASKKREPPPWKKPAKPDEKPASEKAAQPPPQQQQGEGEVFSP
jgi:hypothetical protein